MGRFLAETLNGYGVTHAFFVPSHSKEGGGGDGAGGHTADRHSRGKKPRPTWPTATPRAANRPGVCMAQSVGAANLAAGLQDPYLGLSPVIAITGHRPLLHQYRNSYQEIEHMRPFDSVTKYNVAVDSVEQLPHLLRQAFREATSGAPGPVHLDFQGLQGEVVVEAEADLDVIVEETFTRIPAFRPEPEAEVVREAARVLSEARRPVIVAGGGVAASGGQREVVELAEMMSIPVATSLNAKGTIPDDHPLSVGVVGSYSRWCANRVVAEADLVVFIGSHTGSQVTLDWKVPAPGTPVIQIDIDPSELGRSYPARVALQGDAKVTVRRLIEALEPRGPATDWVGRVRQLTGEWRAEAEPMLSSDASPIRPERICKEITESLPPDALVVSDTGHSGIWTGTMIDLTSPGQGYIRCAGSLGWGFPAALGPSAPPRSVRCCALRGTGLLVPHSRDGDGPPLWHQHRYGGQQ